MHPLRKRLCIRGRIVDAGSECKLVSTQLSPLFPESDIDLFCRFEIVCGKRGAHDEESPDATLVEFGQDYVCIGLDPGVARQPGLERG